MIFGESGVGVKTSYLYAMPGAGPCFNKASIGSGTFGFAEARRDVEVSAPVSSPQKQRSGIIDENVLYYSPFGPPTRFQSTISATSAECR